MIEIDDAISADASAAASPALVALRKRIGWLCQLIRGMAVVWALWVLYFTMTVWGDHELIVDRFAKAYHFEPSALPDLNYYVAFGINLFVWLLIALLVVALWRLFSGYLSGQIFTVEASDWLRRVALVGGLAKIVDILGRPVIFALMTAGHDVGGRSGWSFYPNDLLEAIFVTFLFSLAYIFKTAAELADEHAQIV
jgi:hypothetical protein